MELGDGKGLKDLGVSTEVAYAYMMSEIHRMMNQSGMINSGLNEKKIILRKYIKPAKRDIVEGTGTGTGAGAVLASAGQMKGKGKNLVKKGLELIHPPYQVVFLSMNSLQAIPTTTRDEINNFWVNIKKNSKKKLVPSVSAFYGNLAGFK